MGGFLAIYDETDRIELGGGYYVDIKRYLDTAAWSYAQRKLVDPRLESKVAQSGTDGNDGNDGEVRSFATMFDQQAYNAEVLAAAIVDWNLTDRAGVPMPLPPYIAPKSLTGDDKANLVRREQIGKLPAYATKKILAKIDENEKLGADASFPGTGEGAPTEA